MSRSPGTLVDSSVLLDVFTEDARWMAWSRDALAGALARGPLVINVIVVAKVAPRFPRIEELRSVLGSVFVIEEIPTGAAFLAGHAHAAYRRGGGGERSSILPDFLIGAHAAVTERPLLTRDPQRVRTHFPGVELVGPG